VDEVTKAAIAFNRVHGFGKQYALMLWVFLHRTEVQVLKAGASANGGARTFDDLLASTDDAFGRKVSKAQKVAFSEARIRVAAKFVSGCFDVPGRDG